jgi:transposase
MIQITPQMLIFVALTPIDCRKGIDGLVSCCKQILKKDPFSGILFLFRNRGMTRLKVLMYDGQGFWLCTKRLSKGKFSWWPTSTNDDVGVILEAHELQTLLWNGNPTYADFSERWRRIPI